MRAIALALASSTCISLSSYGAIVSPVLKIGDTTGIGAVSSVGGVAINQVGGYAVGFSVSDVDAIFGSANGSGGAVLVQEGLIGGENVTSLLTNALGIANDGTVVWRGSTGSSLIGLSDGTIVAKSGNSVPAIPGNTYFVPNGPAISSSGSNVAFRASYGSGGAGSALFSNGGNTALLVKGSSYVAPGLVKVTSNMTGSSFSPNATHYTANTQVTPSDASTNDVFIVDGLIPTTNGGYLREGEVVPVASGGDGTFHWKLFSSATASINDSGNYLVTGSVEGASVTTSNDGYLALNGNIILREGDTIGSTTLSGTPLSGALSNSGDWAVVWDTAAGRSLIYDGQILLTIGDNVGAMGTLDSFTSTGSNMLQLAPNGDIFFRATTSTGGDGIYVLSSTIPEPASIALIGLGAIALIRRRA